MSVRLTKRSIRKSRVLHRLLRNPAAVVSLGFIALLVFVAVFAPVLTPHDPASQELVSLLQGPSGDHWLGTDGLGRDVLSRLIQGTRISMLAALQGVGLAVALGLPTGLLAGFTGGRIDTVISRIGDVFMALPGLILALAIAGVLGPGLTNAMIAIGVISAPRLMRIARAAALSVRHETYVEAQRAVGCSTSRILWRHVLPNASGPLLVQITFLFGAVVLAEASLGFLGLGAVPPTASWGNMLKEAFLSIHRTQNPMIAPSVMIMLTILAFSVLGDALRDALGRQTRIGD
jgi:peptide/nickel transport system permease protein